MQLPKQYRILLISLGAGLLLAILVIMFLPEEIPGSNQWFMNDDATTTQTPANSDAALLQGIDEEIRAIEKEYNFNEPPTEEDLLSPELTIEEGLTQ